MEHLNEMQQKQMARKQHEKPGSDDDETRPAFKEDPQQQKMLFDAESTINQIAIRWHNEVNVSFNLPSEIEYGGNLWQNLYIHIC